jgi:hypothetical protein
MNRRLIKAVLAFFLFIQAGYSIAQDISSLLPSMDKLNGWKFIRGPEVYSGDKLFDLIDGGADIYFEYGFIQVVSADYSDPAQNITQAEIYEMTDASSAYGIFSLMQQAPLWNNVYGQLAVVTNDYIAYWKGRYYVIISWNSRRDASSRSMEILAGMINENLKETGDYPGLIDAFHATEPGKRAVYIEGNLALSNFYYFDYKDIFEISEAIACTPENHHRIIFRYPDTSRALLVFSSAKQAMMANKRFTDVSMVYQGFTCKDNKGNQILVKQEERFIIVLVSLKPGTALTPLMDEVVQKIESL